MSAPEQGRELGDVAEAERTRRPLSGSTATGRNCCRNCGWRRPASRSFPASCSPCLSSPGSATSRGSGRGLPLRRSPGHPLYGVDHRAGHCPPRPFRRHAKGLLVDVGDAMAKTGLSSLALTVVPVVVLVFGFVIDVTAGLDLRAGVRRGCGCGCGCRWTSPVGDGLPPASRPPQGVEHKRLSRTSCQYGAGRRRGSPLHPDGGGQPR